MLEHFFNPHSVAVIGASTKPKNLGNVLLKNMIDGGFLGDIFPINPRAESILGLKAYPSILEVKADVDLAIILVPAPIVIDIIRQCGEKGVKAIVIISAGFSEIGKIELEKKLVEEADRWGIRIIGPNCAGTINTYNKLFATIESRIERGNIAFVTQSGALGGAVLAWAANERIGFSKFISYGNACDVDESDLLLYLSTDNETMVITLYLEGVKDGRKFFRIAKGVSQKKPIIAIKGGLSKAGAGAVRSHTGAIAGNSQIYISVFKQAKIIRASGIEDMFDMAKALIYQRQTSGHNVVVLTNSGGPAVMVVDELEALGLSVPGPSSEIRERLSFLPQFYSVNNPIDLTAQGGPEMYEKVFRSLFSEEYYDAGIVICVPPISLDAAEVAKAVVDVLKDVDKPIVACWMAGHLVERAVQILEKNKIPNYPTPKRAAKALSVLMKKQNINR